MCIDQSGPRPCLLSHGLRRRVVTHGRRQMARSVRYRLGLGRDWPTSWPRGSPCCRRSTGRPRAWMTSAVPTGSTTARSTAGPTFFERIKGRELPGLEVATGWLREHRPLDYIPGLMHGDYQFANVMYRTAHRPGWRPSSTGRWARSAIPSSIWHGWSRAGRRTHHGAEAATSSYVDMTGMPTRTQVLDHYRTCRGVRSRTSTTTWSWPSGSWPSCWSRDFSVPGTTRSSWPSARSWWTS